VNTRSRVPPTPKVHGPLPVHNIIEDSLGGVVAKRRMLRSRGRSIVERNLKKNDLHGDHEACLEEQGKRVAGAEPVEES
jgi:hypothetical protein